MKGEFGTGSAELSEPHDENTVCIYAASRIPSLVDSKPRGCAAGIVKLFLYSKCAAVSADNMKAQQNPPRSPFTKGDFHE
jgi:hypothetical protein